MDNTEKIKSRRRRRNSCCCNYQTAVVMLSLISCSLLVFSLCISVEAVGITNVIHAVKALFSLTTSSDHWAFKLKDMFQYGRNYFSPPNTECGGNEEEGYEEKVKEAAVKTLEKSKVTVEGPGRFTEEAMEKTGKKLKGSFSDEREAETDSEIEL